MYNKAVLTRVTKKFTDLYILDYKLYHTIMYYYIDHFEISCHKNNSRDVLSEGMEDLLRRCRDNGPLVQSCDYLRPHDFI